MRASYPGRCASCNGPILTGDLMEISHGLPVGSCCSARPSDPYSALRTVPTTEEGQAAYADASDRIARQHGRRSTFVDKVLEERAALKGWGPEQRERVGLPRERPSVAEPAQGPAAEWIARARAALAVPGPDGDEAQDPAEALKAALARNDPVGAARIRAKHFSAPTAAELAHDRAVAAYVPHPPAVVTEEEPF